MNYLLIILGIVIVLIVYYIYLWYTSAASLTSQINLINSNTPIANSMISNPTSAKYTFGAWIYVQSLTNSTVNILKYSDPTNDYFKLFIDTTGVLNVSVRKSDNSTSTFKYTNRLPLQRWSYITVCVNEQYVDLYLDGKLISTLQFAGPAAPATATTTIQFGNSPSNIYLSKMMRWSTSLDATTIFKNYMEGNGTPAENIFGSYHVGISITNDDYKKYYKIV